jgi:uncharacterized protein YyaL (SSP411 family)
MNRLADARSPYLRQHADNPVDWLPWGEEAFARARTEDKPVFLSVGYAACHWCHVMEHESFEDPETAGVLNDVFVPVKVDREERPDVDAVYMKAVQLVSGRGGWPMTVLLLPDGRPFWAGTYLPAETVRDLSRHVEGLWKRDRARVEAQAAAVAERVKAMEEGFDLPMPSGSDRDLLQGLVDALSAAFDATHGGYGRKPKFPPHAELLFLTDRGRTNGGEEGLRQAVRTLEAMDAGGVHDQVGGGFHRYSTDERWFLPHFEKMLYDNALLAQAYAQAYAVTRRERFARVAQATLEWIRRDLARPSGGYASSLDADTDGHEGLTYTWSWDELRAALGDSDDFRLAVEAFGVRREGNFRDEASGRPEPRNVLHLPAPVAQLAEARGVDVAALGARLDAIRTRLLAVRTRRAQPRLDDKVITAWNGLLLSAFAAVGAHLGDARALDDGRRLAEFLTTRSRGADGALLRFPADSGPAIVGFCDDHAHVAQGLLDLAEATGEERWADEARALAQRMVERFEDAGGGGFWSTSARDHEALFARGKETWDSPIPSDNGTAARVLLRLAARTGDATLRAPADRTLSAFRPLMGDARMARGIVALYRALGDRLALFGEDVATAGDARARIDEGVIDLFLARTEAPPGSSVPFAVRIALEKGWHVHPSRVEDEAMIPTSVGLAEGSPVALDVRYPDPVPSANALPRRYEGTFWIRGDVRVPGDAVPGPRRLAVLVVLQACSESSCLAPRELRLEMPFRIGAEGALRHAAVFGR